MPSYSEQLADWARTIDFDDLPADVVENTKYRILDVIGLALAGLGTPYGESLKQASAAMNPPGPSRIFGVGQRVGVAPAAFANGALSQAIEFDDTHNESIVHMSSPSVAAALALAETAPVSGKRADHRRSRSATRFRAASAASHRASFIGAAFIRPDCSRRSASHIWQAALLGSSAAARECCGHRAAALRPACCSAGWTGRSPSSCIPDGRRKAGSQRRFSDARQGHRSDGRVRGTLRFVRIALAGQAVALQLRAHHRRTRRRHWESRTRIVQALIRRACASILTSICC